MKILCGTDFSPQADHAARAAVELARGLGDTIVLAHVVEPPASNLVEAPGGLRVPLESFLRDYAPSALAERARSLGASGVAVDTRLLWGEAHEALTVYAKEIDARLIVLGTHGRKPPQRWLVGSVAERTQKLADRPVLVVREEAKGLGAWASGKRPLRVLVGLDGSKATQIAIEWMKELRKAGPCLITCVHASTPFAYEPASDTLAILYRELHHALGELERAKEVSLRILPNWTSSARTLVDFAEAEQMELIIVGTHQRTGRELVAAGSVARDLLRQSHLPVLTIPEVSEAAAHAAPMPRLHKILAATDLSQEGNCVVPYAIAMARHGGTVVLCHIATGQGELDKAAIEKKLRGLVPSDAYAYGVKTEIVIQKSDEPGQALAGLASRIGADAVCIGAHAHSAIWRTLSTATADRIPLLPDLPLFVIKTRSAA